MKSRHLVTILIVLLVVIFDAQGPAVGLLQAQSATPAATMAAGGNPFNPTKLRALADELTTATAGQDPSKYKFALVVNVISAFWTAAAIGEQRAASEIGVPTVFEAPPKAGDIASQQSLLETLVTDGYSGVAFSAIDPSSVVPIVKKGISAGTNFILMDSDSPDSGRSIFVGLNNFQGGLLAGKAMVDALGANCGKVVGFVGFITAQNAVDRIAGIKEAFKDSKCTLETVLVDNGDPSKALSNSEAALTTYPDLAGMIGIYSYNGPAAIQALKTANNTKVKLVAFDLEKETMQGLKEGVVSAAIGQRVYYYGYLPVYILYAMSSIGKDKTMAILAPYLSGDKKDNLDTGADVVTPDTLASYQDYLNSIGIKSQ
ncbi:MAG: substrate-binding domain-containing protein [Chloroflexota bacterium]